MTNDWALAIVGPGGKTPTANLQLDATVGGSYSLGYTGVTKGDKLYAFGYPAAGKYHGSDLVYCAGAIIEDAAIVEPHLGHAVQHDRRLVRRTVAVDFRRARRAPGR